jgi:hypothetical protein
MYAQCSSVKNEKEFANICTVQMYTYPGALPSGLPDGVFAYQISQFGYIMECLVIENVGKFYGH